MISTTSYWQRSRSGGKGESHMPAINSQRARGTTMVKHVPADDKKIPGIAPKALTNRAPGVKPSRDRFGWVE
jgi:hypothetical protein